MQNNIPTPQTHISNGKLRIAYNAYDAGTNALRSLIPQYMHQNHVEVEMIALRHEELHDVILDAANQKSSDFDIFSVDTPWLPYFHNKGVLLDLTELVKKSDIPQNLAPNVLSSNGIFNDQICGVPHTYALQLLFYRKDFFEDPDIAMEFYNQYHVKLAPPTTWHMYNIISEFFTQRHNSKSPTQYGTNILGANIPHLSTELHPRIWAYGGKVMDNAGHIRLYSPEIKKAYQSLLRSLQFSAPITPNSTSFDGLQLLANGEIAMCIAFSNNASFLLDSDTNLNQDKIGFAPIPSRRPTVSGWNTCINMYSKSKEIAWNFIKWFSSMDIAATYTLMGGAAPMTALLQQESFAQMYPWTSTALNEYHTGSRRELPMVPGATLLDPAVVDDILTSVVYACHQEHQPLETALYRAHRQLCSYAEENGYPQNIPSL